MTTVRVAPPELASRQTTVSIPGRASSSGRGLPQVRTTYTPDTRPRASAQPPPPLPSPSRIPVRRARFASQPVAAAPPQTELNDMMTFANSERVRSHPLPSGSANPPPRRRHIAGLQDDDDLPSDLDVSDAGDYDDNPENDARETESIMSGDSEFVSDGYSDISVDSNGFERRDRGPSLTHEQRKKEKLKRMMERVKLISWLHRKQRSGQYEFEFDENAPTSELQYIKQKIQFDNNGEATVTLYRRGLMMLVAAVTSLSVWLEWQNVQLKDYDKTFSQQINKYDELLFDVYDKYGGEEPMDPLVTLGLHVGTDMVNYSFKNTMSNKMVDHVRNWMQTGPQPQPAPPAQQPPPPRGSQPVAHSQPPSVPPARPVMTTTPVVRVAPSQPPPPPQPRVAHSQPQPQPQPPRPQQPQPAVASASPATPPPVPPGAPGAPSFGMTAATASAPKRSLIMPRAPSSQPSGATVASRPPFSPPAPGSPPPAPAPPLSTVTVDAKNALAGVEEKLRSADNNNNANNASSAAAPSPSGVAVRSFSLGTPPGTPITIQLSPRRKGGVIRPPSD